MQFGSYPCEEFVKVLASREPVPGGGGASALMGAIGAALGNMVGSLTVGKKKYADVEADMLRLKGEADALQAEFLSLMDQDAEAFQPLSKAYGLPRDTEEQKADRAEVMEAALKTACAVPLTIMERCCQAIALMEQFAEKGTAIAVSDAGCGAACCRAALTGASLNVFINTKSMTDRTYAEDVNRRANDMLNRYVPRCDAVVEHVASRFR